MTTKSKAKRRGGRREGSGRPSLFPGKVRTRHATAYLTPDGWDVLPKLQAAHAKRNKDVDEVSVSDTIEDALHARAKQLGVA